MKCPYCGAEVSPARGKCEYCGGAVDPPKTPDPPTEHGRSSREAVFERICASPQYKRRTSAGRQKKLPAVPVSADMGPFIALIGFAIVGVFFLFGIGGSDGSHSGDLVAAFPLIGIVIAALLVVIVSAVKTVKEESGVNRPTTAGEAVIIVTKRTAVSSEGNNSSASTTYFLTAEFRDGQRYEYQTIAPELYGKVAEGDAGVLFVRDAYALDFDRVMSLW